jgi:taurine dioxygenase
MLAVRDLDGPIGAEVTGLDLAKELSDAQFEQMVDTFHRRALLVFPEQDITPAQQVAFSKRWGPLDINVRAQYNCKTQPEVLIISNILENGEPIGVQDAGRFWHTDLCYLERPSRTTIIHAIEVPSDGATNLGDTFYSSMTAAYEALPDELKARLNDYSAIHSYEHTYDEKAKLFKIRPALSKEQKSWIPPDVVQPVIRRHPYSQARCLYVNEGYTTRILELPKDESDELLRFLFEHVKRPEFLYRHNWQPHQVVMWDNCLTQHKATADYELPQRRLLERTTVIGEKSGTVRIPELTTN